MSSTVFIIAPKTEHTATVIFLHGLGQTGYKWSLKLEKIQSPHIKYIFPTGNTTMLVKGVQLPAWLETDSMTNIDSLLTSTYTIKESSIKEAVKTVHGMVEEEISHGIDSQRIILGGFSQGGAIACYSAVTFKQQLAGVVALSSPMVLFTHRQISEGRQYTPILQCHGDCDEAIPQESLLVDASQLKSRFINYELKTYKGLGHRTCDEEMQDVKLFIDKHLPPVKSNL